MKAFHRDGNAVPIPVTHHGVRVDPATKRQVFPWVTPTCPECRWARVAPTTRPWCPSCHEALTEEIPF